MAKKRNNYLFIYLLLITFSLFLYVYFKPYSYEKKYVINEFKVYEKYDLKTSNYTFKIEFDDKIYPFVINSKYLQKRSLIESINYQKSDEEVCIIPISNYLNFYPLCSDNNEIYSYNLSNLDISFAYNKIINNNINYENIIVNYLNNKTFLLFNYKGFYLINDKITKDIELFDKDIYRIDLIYQLDNYLLIPNYDKNYYFNELYLINIKDGKIKKIDSEDDISFESEFLGDYKNKIYLLDNKEKKEYKININKGLVENIDYQSVENKKINNNEFSSLNYEVIDNKLYLIVDEIKIRISNNNINRIIKIDKETVYYLSEDKLYMYNNKDGEILLITNFEWNFNDINMIYFI